MSKKIAILSVCALCFLLCGCNTQNDNGNLCDDKTECMENSDVNETTVESDIIESEESPFPMAEVGGDSVVTGGDRDSGTIEPGEIEENL